jgi:hypothetical protein
VPATRGGHGWESGTAAAQLFTEEPTFRGSSDVIVDLVGEPDQAGFVQVIQGRGTDPARAHELMMRNREEWADFRPDVLGSSMVVLHPDNAYTMAAYFTSEQQAREGNARSHRRH